MINKRMFLAFLISLLGTLSSDILAQDKSLVMGNVEEGKVKAVLCTGCHGMKGEGKVSTDDQPAVPLLAGQIPGYFVKSMYDYKMDKRDDALMNAISKGLTDVDIANLAAYYASLGVN